jgi:hypothetical protein
VEAGREAIKDWYAAASKEFPFQTMEALGEKREEKVSDLWSNAV